MTGEAGYRIRADRGRVSRRRLLRSSGIAGAGLAAMALAGCSSGKSGTKPAPSAGAGQATPKRGGTLTLSINYQQKFDPHTVTISQVSLYGLFYQGLVRYNPRTYGLEPELAQKWESPSPTELVFTLLPNVRWHNKPPANGRPLKVEDVIYSLNRARTNDPRFIYRSSLDGVDKFEAINDRTLKVTLKRPNAYQLGNFAVSGLKILAQEVVEASKDGLAEADSVAGTGAFVLQSRELNVGSVLMRNPIYYRPNLPYVDRIEGRVFQDSQAEWSAYLAGKIDKQVVPGDQAKQIETQHKGDWNLDWVGDPAGYMQFANTRRKPFDDLRVTRALRLLTDHTELNNAWAAVWFGRGRYASIFPAALESWDLTEQEYGQHLEWKNPKDDAIKEAVSLLMAAGFSKDKPLKFTMAGVDSDYNTASRQLIQSQFKKNGQGLVDPDIRGYQEAAFTPLRANGDFDYFIAGNSAGGFQPDDWFSSLYQTGGSRNYGKFSDPKLDQMFEKQRMIYDEAERKKAVKEIILSMMDASPYTCQAGVFNLNATRRDIHDTPPEGKSFKWSERYESIWRG